MERKGGKPDDITVLVGVIEKADLGDIVVTNKQCFDNELKW